MKKTLFLFSLLSLSVLGFSQITLESGAQLIISSGSTVIANDGIVNNDGSINNSGTVEIKGNLENNTSALIASSSTGTVKFNGTAAQEITGTADADFYGNLEIDNANGVALTSTATGSDQTINGTLIFTNGLLTLNGFNLELASAVTTAGSGKYVQTNSTGYVSRNVPADGSTNVVFPVGNGTYNPITLQNSAAGTLDNYNVRVVDTEPAAGSTAHFVDRSWVITEGTALGSDLTVTPQWNGSEELTDFDRDNAAIGLTADGGSTYAWSTTGTATGSDPYTYAGTGFTDVGTFTVGDYFFSGKTLDLKFFLAGAYNGSTMNNTLYTAGLIPLKNPYGLLDSVLVMPNNAVDWIKIELRDKTDHSSVLHTFARLIDINGQVIEEDGTDFNIKGVLLDDYFVAVLHRNHFGVVSSTTIDLDVSSPSYNFSGTIGQAWNDATVSTNAAMKDVFGVFCLWDGDANGNGSLVYNGGNSDRVVMLDDVGGVSNMSTVISSVYSTSDVNMDGNIVYNGGGSDRVKLLDNVGGVSNMSTVFQKHLP